MKLLTPNPTTLQKNMETVIVGRMNALDFSLKKFWNTEQIPTNLLPWFAWSLGVVLWPSRDIVRRAVTRNSFSEIARRGTTAVLIEALACLGASATVEENVGGVPFTATITIHNSQDFDASQRNVLSQIVEIYKRLSVETTISYTEGASLQSGETISGESFKKLDGTVVH